MIVIVIVIVIAIAIANVARAVDDDARPPRLPAHARAILAAVARAKGDVRGGPPPAG